MILVAAQSSQDTEGQYRGSCCARVANTPYGEVAMAIACGDLLDSRVTGLVSSTYARHFAQWFGEILPHTIEDTLLSGSVASLLDKVEEEWMGILVNLKKLVSVHARETESQLAGSIAAVFALESMYLIMVADGGFVHCLPGGGQEESFSGVYTGEVDGGKSNARHTDLRTTRGVLERGNVLIASSSVLETVGLSKALSSISVFRDSGQFDKEIRRLILGQNIRGASLSCLAYCGRMRN